MKNTMLLFGENTGLISRPTSKTKKLKRITLEIISTILVLLWVYTAGDKLADYENYRRSMYLQVFDEKILHVLVPSLPYIELVAACFLLTARYRMYGFLLSTLMMGAFTVYVSMVYFGYFPQRPCSCAGLFEKMGWGSHLILNGLLFILALSGLLLNPKGKEVRGAA